MREKQKCARIYGVLEKQFRGYYEEANRRQGKTGENLLRILETPSRQRRLPRRLRQVAATWPARSSATATSWSTATRSTSRRTASASNDIVEVRERSLELTPFVVARAEAGERTVPAWLEVIPNRMRILVHSLPARQVIDTPVQEQLIVELYSK